MHQHNYNLEVFAREEANAPERNDLLVEYSSSRKSTRIDLRKFMTFPHMQWGNCEISISRNEELFIVTDSKMQEYWLHRNSYGYCDWVSIQNPFTNFSYGEKIGEDTFASGEGFLIKETQDDYLLLTYAAKQSEFGEKYVKEGGGIASWHEKINKIEFYAQSLKFWGEKFHRECRSKLRLMEGGDCVEQGNDEEFRD